MTKIEQLETAVGKPIEQWNVSDLDKFSLKENLELLQFMKEPDVIGECVKRSKNNKDVEDVLVPLYVKSLVSDAENLANDILKDKEDGNITNEDAKTKTIDLLNKSLYHKLVAYLVLISTFEDYDIQSKEIDIKEQIGQLKEVICAIVKTNLESCYSLVIELLELLFPLRSRYYEKFKIDILDDADKRLETALDDIHSLEMMIMEQLQAMNVGAPDLPDAIKEDLEKSGEGDKNE